MQEISIFTQGLIPMSRFDDLDLNEKEAIAAEILGSLPAESKAKLLQKELSGSGLIVVLGSNCSVNSDIAIHIQNAPNLDLGDLLEKIVDRRKRDRDVH